MDSDTSAMLAKYRDRLNEYRNFVEVQEEKVTSVETSMEHPPPDRSPRRQTPNGGGKEEGDVASQEPTPRTTSAGRPNGHVDALDQSAVSANLSVSDISRGPSLPVHRPSSTPSTRPVTTTAAGGGISRGGAAARHTAAASATPHRGATSGTPHRSGSKGAAAGPGHSGASSAARASSPWQRQQQPISPRRASTPGRQSTSSHLHHSRDARAEEAAQVDRLFEQQGRYYTSAPPDAMYVKSQLWAQKTRQSTAAVRREQEAERHAECTFAPRIDTSPPRHLREARGGDGGGSGTSRGTSPGRVDEAVAQHLARLQAARRLKKEREERLARSPAPRRGGLNELTVPRGPNLGAPVAEPIPSLRKPFVPRSRNSSANGRLEGSRAGRGGGVVRRWVEEDASTRHHGGDADAAKEGVQQHAPPAGRLDSLPAPAVDPLRQQLSEKDTVICGQRERIVSLEQELAEMKALVAQLQASVASLTAQQQQQDKQQVLQQEDQDGVKEKGESKNGNAQFEHEL